MTVRTFLLFCFGLVYLGSANALQNQRHSVTVENNQWNEQDVEAEIYFGRSMAAKMLGNVRLYEDDIAQAYVNQLGSSLAKFSERPELDYYFAVLDSDQVNAFAAPGGYVFITKGALAFCENEAEVAGILAHEIGHVAGRHMVKQLNIRGKSADQMTSFMSAVVSGGTQAATATFKVAMSEALDVWHGAGLKSREDEYDADKRSVRTLSEAGYNPKALSEFLYRVSFYKSYIKQRVRTHPPFDKRIAAMSEFVETLKDVDETENPIRFARNMDSILSYERENRLARSWILQFPALEDSGFQSYLNRLNQSAYQALGLTEAPPVFALSSQEMFIERFDYFQVVSSSFLNQASNEAEVVSMFVEAKLTSETDLETMNFRAVNVLADLGYGADAWFDWREKRGKFGGDDNWQEVIERLPEGGEYRANRWQNNLKVAEAMTEQKQVAPLFVYTPAKTDSQTNKYLNLVSYAVAAQLNQPLKGVALVQSKDNIHRFQSGWMVISDSLLSSVENEAQLAGLIAYSLIYPQRRKESPQKNLEVLNLEIDQETVITLQALGYAPYAWENYLATRETLSSVMPSNYFVRAKLLSEWAESSGLDGEQGQFHQKRFKQQLAL